MSKYDHLTIEQKESLFVGLVEDLKLNEEDALMLAQKFGFFDSEETIRELKSTTKAGIAGYFAGHTAGRIASSYTKKGIKHAGIGGGIVGAVAAATAKRQNIMKKCRERFKSPGDVKLCVKFRNKKGRYPLDQKDLHFAKVMK
jgi:hypothetical protein